MVPSRLRYQSVSWALWGSSPFFLPHAAWVNGFYVKNHVSQLQREKESGSDSVGGGKEWLKPPACHFQQTQTVSPKPFSIARTACDGRQDGLTLGVSWCRSQSLLCQWFFGWSTVPRCLGCPPAPQGGCKQLLISGKSTPKAVKLHTTSNQAAKFAAQRD